VPYDEELANRIRAALADADGLTEQAMFGGLAFLVGGNMAVGASSRGDLIVRVGAEESERLLQRPHTAPFPDAARPMRGWLRVAPQAIRTKRQLEPWVARGVSFAATLPPKRRRRA
jgi:TfoX/Sxy family transcriptional regulator of competence genes